MARKNRCYFSRSRVGRRVRGTRWAEVAFSDEEDEGDADAHNDEREAG
jgi:hypothetical protein